MLQHREHGCGEFFSRANFIEYLCKLYGDFIYCRRINIYTLLHYLHHPAPAPPASPDTFTTCIARHLHHLHRPAPAPSALPGTCTICIVRHLHRPASAPSALPGTCIARYLHLLYRPEPAPPASPGIDCSGGSGGSNYLQLPILRMLTICEVLPAGINACGLRNSCRIKMMQDTEELQDQDDEEIQNSCRIKMMQDTE